MVDQDILGNIAIIKGEDKSLKQKKLQAMQLMKQRPSIKTVLEKATNVKGRLRTIKTRHILGEKNLITKYKENDCMFKFNVETCYFTPRLSNERKIIAKQVKKKDRVLVMFAGVGVYPIVIYKYSKPRQIIGVELGKECCKYFQENLKLNKIPSERVEIIQGDVKKKVNSGLGKFDVVVMARPNLQETFLEQGLSVCKKGTRLFYYGFTKDEEIDKLIGQLNSEALALKRKIKTKQIVPAGDIAPYKHRFRIEIKVLN